MTSGSVSRLSNPLFAWDKQGVKDSLKQKSCLDLCVSKWRREEIYETNNIFSAILVPSSEFILL